MFCRWFEDVRQGKHVVVVVVSESTPPRVTVGRPGLHPMQVGARSNRIAPTLTFEYDREADILYINTVPPYTGQESEELGDEIIHV